MGTEVEQENAEPYRQLSPESRKQNLLKKCHEATYQPTWFRETGESLLSLENLTAEDFAIRLSQHIQFERFSNAEDFEDNIGWLWRAAGGHTLELSPAELYEYYQEYTRLKDTIGLDLVHGAIHTAGITNATANIESGLFKPANWFPEKERRNSIRYEMTKEPEWFDSNGNPIPNRMDEHLSSGHENFVFWASTASKLPFYFYNMYAQGETPVVFWTDKEELNEPQYRQEAGLGWESGEVRIKGAVSTNVVKAVFTDIQKLKEEQIEKLRELNVPILPTGILKAIGFSMHHSLDIWLNADYEHYLRSQLPEGEYEIPGYGTGEIAAKEYIEKVLSSN